MSRPHRVLVVLVGALLVLAGCRMEVAVDVQVDPDGSGVVRVGVGLDEAALARVGDLDAQVRVDDLEAAGWTVVPATVEADGLTWIRASKPFADPEGAAAVLAELTGPDGAFRDFAVTREESLLGTTYGVTGTIDLTGGPEAFSDADLAAALGGDPFGGTLAAIEAEEGVPIEDMVTFRVRVLLPGQTAPAAVETGFGEATPTQVDVSSTQRSALASFGLWLVLGAVGLVGLVALRQAFRHRRA